MPFRIRKHPVGTAQFNYSVQELVTPEPIPGQPPEPAKWKFAVDQYFKTQQAAQDWVDNRNAEKAHEDANPVEVVADNL